MDLREVIKTAEDEAKVARAAYNAGHYEKVETVLHDLRIAIGDYFNVPATPAGDVTETATSEKPAAPSMEKPAEVPGASAQPGSMAAAAAAQQVGGSLTDEKPTQ